MARRIVRATCSARRSRMSVGGNQDFTETDMVTLPGTAVETVIYDEYHPDQEEIMEIVLDWFYRPRE